MKQFPKSNTSVFTVLRFTVVIALISSFFLIAVQGTRAEGNSTSFAQSFWQLFSWQSSPPEGINHENNLTEQTTNVSLPIGVCDTAGPIEIESTGGTTTPTAYATLKAAFDAINAGTHTGTINIEVCGNTTETATADLAASGTGSSNYTSVIVRPVGAGRIIEGSIVGAIVKLTGADNVTIDGRQGGAGTARDLTVRNNNTSASTAAIWLTSTGVGAGATNNTIRNLEIAAGATQNTSTNSTFGIILASNNTLISTSSNSDDCDNNSFIANRIIRARYGIVTRGTTTNLNVGTIVTDNIIGPTSFGADEIGKVGIFMQADQGATVSRNTVQFVGGDFANTTGGTDRVGIGIGQESWSTAPSTLTSNTYTVTKNIIHDVVEERTFSSVGLLLGTTGGGSATNNLVANNFIYNVKANGTGGDMAIGLGISGGHTDKVVFNSISMTGEVRPNASAAATTNYGSGIRIANVNGTTHLNLTLQNNSVYMDLIAAASPTVRYYAISGNINSYSFGTGGENYNNYYINPANTQLQTGGLGSASGVTLTTQFATLANWQTAYTAAQDANSIQSDPLYASNTGDLHIPGSSPNINVGTTIAGVTDDIDEQIRPNGPTVDIGADEFYASPGTLQLSSATYSGNEGTTATITVNRVGGSTGTVSVNYATSNGTAVGGASCSAGIDYISASGTLSWANNDASPKTFTVQLCTDTALTDNLLEPTETVTLTLSSPVGTTISGTNPATLSIVDVPPPLSGSYNVGTGQTYTSLTNPGGIFAALNLSGATSNITINIVSDLTGETGTHPLNELAGGFTVTIKPSGAARSITGATTGNVGLIRLNGADNVTIDGSLSGGTERSLTIQNTNTTTGYAVIQIASLGAGAGASGNTVKNTILLGGTDTSASTLTTVGISNGGTTPGTTGADNDNATFTNNQITKVAIGIYSAGESGTNQNQTTMITNNLIGSAAFGADQVWLAGIIIPNTNLATITGNEIRFIGVTEPQNNSGGSSDKLGISPGFNTVSSTSTGAVALSNSIIARNLIHDIVEENTFSAAGISVSGGNGTNVTGNTIVNNMIYNVRANGTAGDTSGGIIITSGNGDTVAFNSIYNTGDLDPGASTAASVSSFGIQVTSTTPTNLTLKDNISFVDLTSNTATLKHGAIALPASYAFGTGGADFNNYYFPSANTQGILARVGTTDHANLAAYQAAVTPQEAASKSVDPLFVTATNLHIQTASPMESQGTAIAGVTNDFDGESRPATPDIGADEITVAGAGTLQFSSSTYTDTEGNTATITVTRVGGTAGAVSVNYATSNGTATGGASCGTAGVDYVSASGTLSWANGDAAGKTFTIPLCNDTLFGFSEENLLEPTETVNLTLSSPVGTTIGTPGTAVLNITDNPPGTVQFSATTYTGNEGTMATITATRTLGTSGAVSVNYATSDGTATGGASCSGATDYVSASGTLSWANGDSAAKTFNVQLCGDTAVDPGETVNLTLSSPTGGVTIGANNPAVLTIIDTASQFCNADGTITIPTSGSATPYPSVINVSGTTGNISNMRVTLYNALHTDMTDIDILLVGPGGQKFILMSDASSNAGLDAGATLTFSDAGVAFPTSGAVPSGTYLPTDVTSGDTFPTPAPAGPYTSPAPVGTATLNGTFGGGSPNGTWSLYVVDDAAGDTGTISGWCLEFTTSAAPVPGTLQFSSTTYTGAEGTTATITATRTSGSDGAVSVNYATSNGTATGGASCGTAGVDYVSASGTLNWANGDSASKTFTVQLCSDTVLTGFGDDLLEPTETVTLTLSGATGGATIGTNNPATLNITDVPPPTVQFSAATYGAGEGTMATVTVTRSGDTSGTSSVNYATSDGTATGGASCPGSDYVSTTGTLNFAATETSKTFMVQLCSDTNAEATETVNLTLSSPSAGTTIGTQGTAVLNIVDAASQFCNADGTITIPNTTGTGPFASMPYPSVINVSGTTGNITNMRVTLFNYSHTFPDDVDVLLVGPGGQKFILMSDAGSSTDAVNATLTFSDAAAAQMGDSTAVVSGSFKPSNYEATNDTFATGAPAGPYSDPGPGGTPPGTATLNGTFAGSSPNGTWQLYVSDDAGGDGGTITGWCLEFQTAVAPVAGILQFSSTTYTGAEGTTATITATRTGGSDGAVSVDYATSNGTATGGASCGTAGVDYVSASGTLNWANGDTASKTFTVQLCNDTVLTDFGDDLLEPTETVNLTLSNVMGGATIGTNNPATLNITDVPPPTVQFSAATYNGAEGTSATITVTRTGDTTGTSSVNYATSNGTATGGASCPGSDYVSTTGTLNFAAMETSKTFMVQLCADMNAESTETVNLALSSPSSGTTIGTQGTAVLNVFDTASQFCNADGTITTPNTNSTPPFASMPYPSVINVSGTTGNITSMRVTLYNATHTFSDDLDILLVGPGGQKFILMSDAGGGSGLDAAATLTFSDAAASQLPDSAVIATGLYKPSNFETANDVFATGAPAGPYSDPGPGGTPAGTATLNGTFGGSSANGTWQLFVSDDDNGDGGTISGWCLEFQTVAVPMPGSLQFSSATYSVGEAGPTATITATRTGGSDGAVSVDYATSNGTATGGAACGGTTDFVNSSGTLNWANGDSASKTFTIPICDDTAVEGNETVNLALTNAMGGATIGTPATSVLTIVDNDSLQPGTLQFSTTTYNGNEGTTATITVTRTLGSDGAVAVNYATSNGTATGGAACGTAGVDYVSASGTLNWANGDSASKTFTVQLCSDTLLTDELLEPTETVNLTLSSATGGATIGTNNPATLNIVDVPVLTSTVQFSGATYNGAEGTSATVTVTRTGDTTQTSTVNYATSNGTATGGASCPGSDYVNASGTLTFAATETSKTFTVQMCADNNAEATETVNLTLSNPSSGTVIGAQGTAVLNIFDTASQFCNADGTITIPATGTSGPAAPYPSVINVSGTSGTITSMRVTLYNFTHTFPTDVDVLLVSPTGQKFILMSDAGGSQTVTNQTVTFSDSAATQMPQTSLTTGTFKPTNYDTPNDTFPTPAPAGPYNYPGPGGTPAGTDTLGSTFNGISPNGTWQLFINDDGGGDVGTINGWCLEFTTMAVTMPGSLQFNSATYSVGEAGPTATITVTRTGGSDGAVGISYATSNGTATGGAACGGTTDYVNTSGTLSWANGDSAAKTFTVPICDDTLVEPSETVNLALSTATGGATIGTPSTAVLTITDNDVAQPGTIQFSAATYSVSEAGPTATITATRTGGSDGAVGVSYATSNGTATGGAACGAGVDYQNTSGTLSWANGDSAAKTFTVPICEDMLFEGNETVNLALSNPTGGATLGTPSTSVLTITDNDTQPSVQFSAATYNSSDDLAGFDGNAVITVTRTGAPENVVSVNYATSNGTATGGTACGTAGVDYVSTNGTLNFAAGELTKTFNVNVCTDNVFEGNETVNLTLSNPTGAVLGTPNPAVLNILDNDPQPMIQFGTATYTTRENFVQLGVVVTRLGAVGNTVSVNFATSNGTATGGSSCTTGVDFISRTGTLTFAPGETGKTFNIPICNDRVWEGLETFSLTLSNPAGGAILGTPTMATATILNVGSTRVDFDNDGRTEVSVFRAQDADNTYWIYKESISGGTIRSFEWGQPGDIPTPADFDGDGRTDIAIWRPGPATQARFFIFNSATNTIRVESFGQTGDNPLVVGDYDGDGNADLAVYRPGANGIFFYRGSLNNPNGNVSFNPWGTTGDKPAAGDYNGDGKMDFAVYRGNGQWLIRYNTTNVVEAKFLGLSTDRLVQADYDGDGKTDIAVFRSSDRFWYIQLSSNNSIVYQPFGLATDVPVPGDYDGDGKHDIAVYRNGLWFVLQSSNQATVTDQLGDGTFTPLPSFFVTQ